MIDRLIIKLGRLTRTDISYLTTGGFWLTLAQATTALSTLILSVAFANLLTPEVYGAYRYVLAVAGLLVAFSLTGLYTALTRAVSQNFEGALRESFYSSLRWGMVIFLIALMMSGYYYWQNNLTLALSMLLVGISQPLINSGNLIYAYFNGTKNFKASASFHAVKTLVPMGLLLLALLYSDSALLLLTVFFAANAVMALGLYVVVLKKYQPNEERDSITLPYGKHLSVMNFLNIVSAHIDKVLVFQFLGAAELALYAFAVAIPEQIKTSFKNIGFLALPKFSRQASLKEINKTLIHKSLLFGAVLLGITGVYILATPFIYNLLYPQYPEAILFSQVFALSFLAAVGTLPVSAMQAQMERRLLYIFNIVTSATHITLLFVLLSFYGLWGVIFARIIARFFNACLAFILIRKKA